MAAVPVPQHEERFTAHDGLQVHETCWLPPGDPEAAVIVVHGLAEHAGRYAQVAEQLTRHGYAVYATDLRGHGRSQGDRVCIRSFDDYLCDLDLLLDRVRKRQTGKPLFLLGHSMGGTIVARFAATRRPDVRGLVLSAAAIRIAGGLFPVLRRLAALLGRVLPGLRLARVGSRWLSRDPEVVAQFNSDPLVFHGRFPVRTGAEILQAAQRICDQMEALTLPLLILHGTGEFVTDPEGSRRLYFRANSTDKTLKLYPGLYHDLFHEPEWQKITADVIAWLDARRQ